MRREYKQCRAWLISSFLMIYLYQTRGHWLIWLDEYRSLCLLTTYSALRWNAAVETPWSLVRCLHSGCYVLCRPFDITWDHDMYSQHNSKLEWVLSWKAGHISVSSGIICSLKTVMLFYDVRTHSNNHTSESNHCYSFLTWIFTSEMNTLSKKGGLLSVGNTKMWKYRPRGTKWDLGTH